MMTVGDDLLVMLPPRAAYHIHGSVHLCVWYLSPCEVSKSHHVIRLSALQI